MTIGRGRDDMTAGDAAFLDRLIERTRAAYAVRGGEHVVAHVERRDGRIATLTAPPIGGDDEKEAFINLVRHKSLREGSSRAAIVAESWAIIDETEERMAEVATFLERGGRVSAHPLAREMVTITIESDAGLTLQMLSIDRRVRSMTALEPIGGPRFMPSADGWTNEGAIRAFHVPMAVRIRPDVVAWAAWMDANVGRMPWTEEDILHGAETVN